MCACVPLHRLITLADKHIYDNSKDNSMIDFSEWPMSGLWCQGWKEDHQKCGDRLVLEL